MSMQAINFAMTLPVDEPGPRLLLFVIAHHVHWKTGKMYVSQRDLSAEVRSSERTVRRWLDYLQEGEYICREERRDDKGHRLADEIELVGYLPWQDVLYNGGTIRNPNERETPADNLADSAENQPDNLSAREEPNRTKEEPLPDKNGVPTGQQVSGIYKPLITIKNPYARVAREVTPSVSEEDHPQPERWERDDGKGGSPSGSQWRRRKPLTVYPGTKEWIAWENHYARMPGTAGLIERCRKLGKMEVPTRYPREAA